MADLVILVPVLGRPSNVQPILDSIATATPDADVLFIADPDDTAELAALNNAKADYFKYQAGYAGKINEAVSRTSHSLICLAADDLSFSPGWFETANTKMTDNTHVVGLNDMIRRPRRPRHATHFLVTREYAELPTISRDRGPLCEEYDHSFIDDELIFTASRRGMYNFAPEAIVKHHHHINGLAADDDTYRKGRANFQRDRQLFQQRRRTWRG